MTVVVPAWSGPDGIADRLLQHLGVSALAIGVCCLLAIPGGLRLGRRDRERDRDRVRTTGSRPGTTLVGAAAVAGRVVPVLALLGVLAVLATRAHLAHPTLVTVVALVLVGTPPLLSATYRGARDVDPVVREVGGGLGMSARGLLFAVDLPLAAPALLGGLRRCAVGVVAAATTAAVIAGPGLGEFVLAGVRHHDDAETLTGAAVVTALALVVDLAIGGLGRLAGRRLRASGTPTP